MHAIAEDDGVARMVASRSCVAEKDSATTGEVEVLRERLRLTSSAAFADAMPAALEEQATEPAASGPRTWA